MTDFSPNVAPQSGGSRGSGKILWTLLVAAILAGAGWAYLQVRTARTELARAESALKLQVLTSRLGAAAIHAEYGDYLGSRSLASGVFEGIQNYGIEQGYLPENYARVLELRDDVIASLALGEPEVRTRITELFFQLQLPVDTRLDPALIIPATDSGAGMVPPLRSEAGADSMISAPGPDTSAVSSPTKPDTTAVPPPTKPDTTAIPPPTKPDTSAVPPPIEPDTTTDPLATKPDTSRTRTPFGR